MAAPPPVRKPGRVSVYSAVADYEPQAADELTLKDGDLIFVSEATPGSTSVKAKVGNQAGVLPKTLLESENVCLIDYPLHEAAKRGTLELVQDYIANNVSVNALDRSGSTALYWAAFGGHFDVLNFLLSIPHSSASSQNKLGDTAMHAAARKSHIDCLKALIEHAAAESSVHTRNADGKTPVELAATPEAQALLQMAARTVVDPATLREYESSDEDGD